jgi:hypothetical protein
MDIQKTIRVAVAEATSNRTEEQPFEKHEATGRLVISPCATASVHEFKRDGKTMMAGHVTGHGWSAPHEGKAEDHAQDGYRIYHNKTYKVVSPAGEIKSSHSNSNDASYHAMWPNGGWDGVRKPSIDHEIHEYDDFTGEHVAIHKHNDSTCATT